MAWHVSKVEGANPLGIMHYTLAQESWNFHTDVVEYDDDGNVTGMWCDLLKESNLPSEDTITPFSEDYSTYAKITYAGKDPHIKVNGSYKSITIQYYSNVTETVDQTPGNWEFYVNDSDVSDFIKVLETDDNNTIKIKFLGDEEFLGEVLVVKNIREDIVGKLELEIVSL